MMINLKLNNVFPLTAALLFVGVTLTGCNNDSATPKGVEAQKQAVMGGTPPPDAQKQMDAMRAENARKQAEGQAAAQAAAKAGGK